MDPHRGKLKRWAGKCCCCFGDADDAADAQKRISLGEMPPNRPSAINASAGSNGLADGSAAAPPPAAGTPANVASTSNTSNAVDGAGASATRSTPATPVNATGSSTGGDGAAGPPHTEPPFRSSSESELWQRAYDQAVNSTADKNVVAAIKVARAAENPGSTITAEDVVERLKQAITERNVAQENVAEDRKGRSVKMFLDGTVSILTTLTPIGNILFNIDPVHAAGPWAAVQLVLMLLENKKQLSKELLHGLAQVTNLILYCQQYQALYNSSNLSSEGSQGMPGQLEEAIVKTYLKSLLFLGFASSENFARKSTYFTAPLKLGDMKPYVQALVDVGNELVRVAKICDHHRNLQNQGKIEENFQLSKDIFDAIYEQGNDIRNIRNDALLDKLVRVRGATHNSSEDQNDPRCHSGTRVNVLREIEEWTHETDGKRVYWLQGSAGAGKSTVARTLAEKFDDNHVLGASFLFKRGRGDRGHARYFFTTISSELCDKMPSFRHYVQKAIEKDSHISDKAMKTQFEELIDKPLKKLRDNDDMPERMIVVIDALDECENEREARQIIDLFSKISARYALDFKIFITSRPEYHIRLGFKDNPNHKTMVLDKRDELEIKKDISLYMKYELENIRDDYNKGVEYSHLFNWPCGTDVEKLVIMAVPLFIFAATMLRFVSEVGFNPSERLALVLEYKVESPQEQIIATYGPVLRYIMKLPTPDQKIMTKRFREIVGSIVLLAVPLSISSLQQLLKPLPDSAVPDMLARLHSVLDVPSDLHSPIKTFHLSFREFLVDKDELATPELKQFRIDEKETNRSLGMRCLELLSRENLRADMCDLGMPGESRKGITKETLDQFVPAVVQYACRYWIYHLKEGQVEIDDSHLAHTFLQEHFLHWVEVLTLMGTISESIRLVEELRSTVKPGNDSTDILEFLYDAKRLILRFRAAIDEAPLQLYSSAILFSPHESRIRRYFEKHIDWISQKPIMESDWNPCLQTLEGHTYNVYSVAFSGNGTSIASGSSDKTIKIWDVVTGELQYTLHGHTDIVQSVAFSENSKLVASGSRDKTIKVWDPERGELLHTFEGHNTSVQSVAFTPDSSLIASRSQDKTIKIWDAEKRNLLQSLKAHKDLVSSVMFNYDGTLMASGSCDKTVKIWNAKTWKIQWTLEGHKREVKSVAFNADGTLIASGSWDETVKIWDTKTGEIKNSFNCNNGNVYSVAFLDDAKVVVAGRWGSLLIWDAKEGTLNRNFKVDSFQKPISILRKTKLIAFPSKEKVKIWDITRKNQQQNSERHVGKVSSVAFSPDSKLVATMSSKGQECKLWDATSGILKHTLKGKIYWDGSTPFSPNSMLIASASYDDTIQLWDTTNGIIKHTLKGHTGWVNSVAFSPDSKLVAFGSGDGTIQLWDTTNGILKHTLRGHTNPVQSVAFSPDSKLVASGCLANRKIKETPKKHTVMSVPFSATVKIWDSNTGNLLQSSRVENESYYLSFESGNVLQVGSGSLQIAIDPDTKTAHDIQADSDTSLGAINRPCTSSAIQTQAQKINSRYDLDEGRSWVQCDGKNLLWLPPDCRPFKWEVSDSTKTIALLLESDRLVILRFKNQNSIVNGAIKSSEF